MATSLYDLSVPTFLQTVRAVAGFLQRAAKHCAETGADPDDFVHARLIADMAPFHFQIEALSHHSVWGLEAVKTGIFAPPALIGAMPFAGLRALIDEAIAALEALTPAEVNGWAGKALNIALYRPLTKMIAPRPGRRDNSLSRRRLSFFPFRCPTFISTPSPVCTENLDTDVMVMKSTRDRVRFDASGRLNRKGTGLFRPLLCPVVPFKLSGGSF